MTEQTQNAASLEFAQALASRNYGKAYCMLSSQLKSKLTVESLREEFEGMIPLDWGPIDAIEVVESPTPSDPWPFVYVGLGGNLYSEAIIIFSFATEDGMQKIDQFEFGRLWQ